MFVQQNKGTETLLFLLCLLKSLPFTLFVVLAYKYPFALFSKLFPKISNAHIIDICRISAKIKGIEGEGPT